MTDEEVVIVAAWRIARCEGCGATIILYPCLHGGLTALDPAGRPEPHECGGQMEERC